MDAGKVVSVDRAADEAAGDGGEEGAAWSDKSFYYRREEERSMVHPKGRGSVTIFSRIVTDPRDAVLGLSSAAEVGTLREAEGFADRV